MIDSNPQTNWFKKQLFWAEFGDQNKERGVHAILSIPCDFSHEPFFLCLRNVPE